MISQGIFEYRKAHNIDHKLRAECFHDVFLLIGEMPKNVWGNKIEQCRSMPDVEFEFKSKLTKDEIMEILRKQNDSHIMMDTVEPLDQYTGDLKFKSILTVLGINHRLIEI